MTDIEIASSIKKTNIATIAKKLGVKKEDLTLYGDYKAKIDYRARGKFDGKLVLVTAINPTKAGNGKTTVSIGLADAMKKLGKKVCLALREPSLGPVFGIKGGATGGGRAQIVPMEDINLHFNGDFHAVTSANNLLCALVENSIEFGNEFNINPETLNICRCLDVNDRGLRDVELLGLNFKRKDSFVITSASEIMAIMCISRNLEELKENIGNIYVGRTFDNKPVFVKNMGITDSVAILLKDALSPNLVQTLEKTPAIVHMGPFANIAHGCNSISATLMAKSFADYAITEAGFGADLGAEKFIDFKCRKFNLMPDVVVLIATVRALKLHGGASEDEISKENLDAIKIGIENLKHHVSVIKNVYKLPVVITLNKFSTDTDKEIMLVKELMSPETVVLNDVWGKGSLGAIDLAKAVMSAEKTEKAEFSYNLNDTIENKITAIVQKVYGGKGIVMSELAKEKAEEIKKMGLDNLPIIMAKTQFSLSSDKSLMGAPKDFVVPVRDLSLRSGAGFIVAICSNMLLMPGLSKTPSALGMKINSKNGEISGLF